MRLPTARGAILLRRYLEKSALSKAAFCSLHGLCEVQIGRLLRGERRRVSVDTALAIESATEGAVPVRSWAQRPQAAVTP